jgi:CDP-diglyceride synthetase
MKIIFQILFCLALSIVTIVMVTLVTRFYCARSLRKETNVSTLRGALVGGIAGGIFLFLFLPILLFIQDGWKSFVNEFITKSDLGPLIAVGLGIVGFLMGCCVGALTTVRWNKRHKVEGKLETGS